METISNPKVRYVSSCICSKRKDSSKLIRRASVGLMKPRLRIKKNLFPIDFLCLNAFQFARKRLRTRIAQISRQGCRADDGSIMKLHFYGLGCRSNLPLHLQAGDRINERTIHPRLRNTLCLPKGNYIRGCLFDHAKAFELQ